MIKQIQLFIMQVIQTKYTGFCKYFRLNISDSRYFISKSIIQNNYYPYYKEPLGKILSALYGAGDLPKLELFKIVYVLKDLLNQEFVSKLKSQIELTKSINVNFS